MTKASRGQEREGRSSKQTRISDASAAEIDHLESTKRMGKRLREIGPALAEGQDALDVYRQQGFPVDPENVVVEVRDKNRPYIFDLLTLERLKTAMEHAASGREAEHAQSLNPAVRRSARRALRPDKPISDKAHGELVDKINKLADNY